MDIKIVVYKLVYKLNIKSIRVLSNTITVDSAP